MKFSDTEDQLKREDIKTIGDVPTMYRPLKNLVMILPLPDIEKIGRIILPNNAQMVMNEGHVIALGPECAGHVDIGDCVSWDTNTENSMDVEGVKFLLVAEVCLVMKITRKQLEASAVQRPKRPALKPHVLPPDEDDEE